MPAQPSPAQALPAALTRNRVASIDLLRGIVMIIMALDHVRDYFHRTTFYFDPLDLSHTSVYTFFTRWITHFCAPVFMFLAGISANLYGQKNGQRSVSFFLLTRGLVLILAELSIVSIGWSFNVHFTLYILQVIWAFGVSMIALSAILYLDRRLILLIGLLLIGAHDLLNPVHVDGNGAGAFFWAFLHEQRPFFYGHVLIFMGYPILPWIGIICIGYFLGAFYAPDVEPARRKKTFLTLGLGAILLFTVLRLSNLYGNPSPWMHQRSPLFTFLSFLNTSKYPPSLLYALMTLGPALVFLALSERPLNSLTRKITIFGRVPMFYYLLHIYLVHALAVIAVVISGHPASQMILSTWVTENHDLRGYGYTLPVVYLIWIAVILILYPLCKWFDAYKRSHLPRQKWLSYL
jgi:uncharacterized membrane protein